MRILIGFDGSDGARAAVSELTRAGLPVAADVLVLAAADAAAPDDWSDDSTTAGRVARAAYDVAVDDARACAEAGRRLVAEVEPSWRVECDSPVGPPAPTLLDRTRTWKADLLVVGSTGRSAIGRRVFGSVADKLLREAPCGIRIGRGRPAAERPGAERLVLGVDGSPGSDAALATLLSRKWNAGSAVRVVTALEPSDGARFGGDRESRFAWLRTFDEVAVEKLLAAGLDAAPILVENGAAQALVGEAESWGADCIFVGAHGRHGAERALLGGAASATAVGARCSVEVVRSAPATNEDFGARRTGACAAR
jgi:nucleotide-binding universal stress UspA family protein